MPETPDVLKAEKSALEQRLRLIEKAEQAAAALAELYEADPGLLGLVLDGIPRHPQQPPPEGRGRKGAVERSAGS